MRCELWVVAALVGAAGCGGGGGGGRRGASTAGAAVGTTVVAGALVEARAEHTATTLDDGARVLIAGGATLRSPVTAGAELWEAGQSRPLPGGLGVGRAGHGALLLPDGRVWILGGHDAQGRPLRSTELWDPVQERFVPGPDLLRPRDRAGLAVTSDAVWLACGRGEASLEAWGLDLVPRGVALEGLPGGPRTGSDLVAAPGLDLLLLQGGVDEAGEPVGPAWIDLSGPVTAEAVRAGEPFVEGARAVVASLDGAPPEIYLVGGFYRGKVFQELQRVRRGDRELVRVLPRPLVPRERAAVLGRPEGVLLAGGLNRGFVVETVELLGPGGASLAPSLAVARADALATPLGDGSVLFSGGRSGDGLPVALTELLVPPGRAGPGADALYARAAADRASRDQLSADVQRLGAELSRTQDALRVEGAERARLQGERDAAQARLRTAEGDLAQAQATLTQTQQQLQAAQAGGQASQARAAQLERELQAALGLVSMRIEEVRQAQLRIQDLERRAGALEVELNMLRAERDRLAAELAAARAAKPTPSRLVAR